MTPTEFRTVRIFLSSTFRDFALERDLLVRKVFPELRRKCRERQVTLVDVDLRWGITEQEAQQGKVLPICLAEIDRARPYFIGLLGERYGWVPQETQYDLSLLVEQPWLEEHRGGKSVTELEILHGVLNNPKMAGRAFFYFRDPEWSTRQGGVYASEGAAEKGRLEALKGRIRRSGFPVVEDYPDPEALAERVREDLWRLIDETYPADAVPDALTRERTMHEAYGATRQRLYLGGEEYFKALDQAMRAEKFSPLLITGQSGGGKSALLANWVMRWQAEHLETAVILHHLGCGADAADPVRLVTRLMQEIARLTGEEFKPESDPEKQLEQLQQWLALGSVWAEREGREVLLVLDGLDKVSDRKELRWFPSFLPSGVKLVTSCLEGEILQAAKGRLEWRELEVKPFSQTDQMLFIAEYLGRYRKSLTAQQTRTLQGHPLSGNPLFLLTVLEELRVFGVHEELDQRLNTLLSPPPSKSEGEAPTVDDVFEHVLARIEADLGEKVVQATVAAIWASRGGLLREELLAVAQLTPAAWASLQNALDEGLYESSGRISFGHDYLRKAVEDRYDLTGERKLNVHRRLANHFAGLPVDARVAEELPWQWEQAGDQEKLKACLTDRAVFVALNERDEYELLGYWVRLEADINAAYEAAWKDWGLEDEAAAEVGVSLADFLLLAGCYTTFALGLREELLRLKRAKLGAEHPDTLDEIEALAPLYAEAGLEHEAIGLQEEVLRLRREKLGADHPHTLGAMHNLAISYRHAGRLEEALVMGEEVLRLRREKLGADHHDTLTAMQNLANSYSDAGRLEEALGMREEVLRLMSEKLGADHLHTLGAMGNLAISYSDTGRLEEALEMVEKTLRLRREKLGADHWSSLMTMGNLADYYMDAGRVEEALGLREEALRMSRERLGSDNLDTLMAMGDLATCYNNAGRLEEALGLREKVLPLIRERLGAENEHTLTAMNALAAAYYHADRFEESIELEEELVRIIREKLGPEHQDTLNAMQSIALSYWKAGRQHEAVRLHGEVLPLLRKKLGADHPDTLRAQLTLAKIYSKDSRLEEALSLLEEVLNIIREVQGVRSWEVLKQIGEFVGRDNVHQYGEMGLRDRVIYFQEELLRLSREQLGAEHLDTLAAMGKLGALYRHFARLEQGLKLKEEHVRLMRGVLGAEHWDTLNATRELAGLLENSDRLDEAIILKEEVLRVRRKNSGAENPFTLIALENLIGSYYISGRLEDAVMLIEEFLPLLRQNLGEEDYDTLYWNDRFFSTLKDLGQPAKAVKLLRKASTEFPTFLAHNRYKFTCFECLSGNLEEAKRLITEEIAADPSKKEQALQDSDFATLHDFIATL